MTDTPWTYHTTQIIPSRKAHRVMEGIKPIASCNSEKYARLIVSMKDANAELLDSLEHALRIVCRLCVRLNPQHKECASCYETNPWREAIAKAKANG